MLISVTNSSICDQAPRLSMLSLEVFMVLFVVLSGVIYIHDISTLTHSLFLIILTCTISIEVHQEHCITDFYLFFILSYT